MKNLKFFGFLIVAAFSVTGCSNPTSSAEYKTLKSNVEDIQIEVDSLQSKLDSVDSLGKKLEDVKAERLLLIDNFATLVSLPSRRSAVINKLVLPACKTSTYAFYDLRAKYDDDMTGIFQDEFIKLIGQKDADWYYAKFSDWSNDAGDELPAIEQFLMEYDYEKCSSTYFQSWVEEKCETFDRLMLKKDTDSFIGRCLRGTVKISQSDAATGPCGFQGYISGDYDVRAQFGTTLDTATHASQTECSDTTKKLTEGKTVQFLGFVIGSYTYTTTSNGSMTIPAFKLVGVLSN